MNRRLLLLSAPFFIGYTILIVLAQEHGFFWDTVMQASRWAHWYYEHNFQFLFLPPELDAGHPPGLAISLAVMWKLFGQSLVASHWLLWPFVLGIVWQTARIVDYCIPSKWQFWAMLIVLTDATLMAQCSMVSVDVWMTFFTLLALVSILKEKPAWLMIATVALALCSLRGLFSIAVLGLFFLWYHYARYKVLPFWKLWCWLPALAVLAGWYSAHYWATGWYFQSPNPGWAAHRELTDWAGLVKNVAVLGWRMLDFGRLGEWLVVIGLFLYFYKNKLWPNGKTKLLIGFLVCFFVIYGPLLIMGNNPIGHRYLLPAFLLFSLLCCQLLLATKWSNITKKGALLFILLMHIGGHFWVYPPHIAQGWESSLAHWPYFELRQEAIDYLDEQAIPLEVVGTEFPNIGGIHFIDLNHRQDGMVEKNMHTDPHILYTNVFNDFSEEELRILRTHWQVVKHWEKGQVFFTLYKK